MSSPLPPPVRTFHRLSEVTVMGYCFSSQPCHICKQNM
ncbi:hypothetical protein KNP414_04176 [Paenibacillus mucilaginosus KNP414]|uniref:Uncharacterized protein n=1 Tax=Paenibacillus mucilaginosus (strain KNP414) TaxID=1036673 RepID=F8FFT1_PAEMK|nr:hypothetical protein KNP414_04176 [Paenibacillus mucilaginosus KNP414]